MPTRRISSEPKKGLNLLSFDAGGSRAISQLQILKHVPDQAYDIPLDYPEERKEKPCEVFDLIGGVGSGGLVAILLVIFGLTASEALEEFTEFSVKVFKDVNPDPMMQTRKLKRAVQDILEKHEVIPERKLISIQNPMPRCKLIVPVMYKNHVGSTCILSNISSRGEPSTNLTVAEAMLATMATAPTFDPVAVSKDFSSFEYISGELGLSNPVREVIAGAHRAFGNESTIACLLSIGCGNSGVNRALSASESESRTHFLERVAFDSEKAAAEIDAQVGQLALYHRLSVTHGLEVSRYQLWNDPSDIAAHTKAYLEDLEVIRWRD